MRAAARAGLALPLLAALAWLGTAAVESASTDSLVYNASREMGTWTASRAEPGIQTWLWVRDDLKLAAQRAPSNATVHEMLGMLGSRNLGRREHSAESLAHFRRAIELRPTSPYTWTHFAQNNYDRGASGRELEAALLYSAALGPSEPDVQRSTADLALAVWDEIGPETRASAERAIAAGLRRNPPEMLQIGERRGRLAVVCRQLPATPRTTQVKWAQFCQGMESIS